MPEAKVTKKYQITIPRAIRRTINLQAGDIVDLQISEEGTITLIPKKSCCIPDNERWFWTQEWQEGEREADKDIQNGRLLGPFEHIQDALTALKKTKVIYPSLHTTLPTASP